jgi:hypothetical protein
MLPQEDRGSCTPEMEDKMSNVATIGHTAVRVSDIVGMTALLEDLLGFRVLRTMGDAETPSNVWLVADRDAMVQECEKRGFTEVRTNWYALPDGLVLEFLPME